jgi:hypothetical protein
MDHTTIAVDPGTAHPLHPYLDCRRRQTDARPLAENSRAFSFSGAGSEVATLHLLRGGIVVGRLWRHYDGQGRDTEEEEAPQQ